MKKILKTALATFFTLIVCFPDFAEKQGEKTISRTPPASRQLCTKRPMLWKQLSRHQKKERLLGKKQKELEQKQKELEQKEQALTGLTSGAQELASEISYLCICPIIDELIAVYESLHLPGFIAQGISQDIIDELCEALYGRNGSVQWRESISKKPILPDGSPTQPIYFFKNEEGKNLCLAFCGKGPIEITSFCSKLSNVFKNLKHVLVCGICACTDPNVHPGSVLLCTKYLILSGNDGKPPSETIKGKEIYIVGGNSYFTNPHYLTCNVESSLFKALTKVITSDLKFEKNKEIFALNVSFGRFIADLILVENLNHFARTLQLSGCIDMEGTQLANYFYTLGKCTFLAIRYVSDNGYGRNKEGKEDALIGIRGSAGLYIYTWMSTVSIEDQLSEEEPPKQQTPISKTLTGVASEWRSLKRSSSVPVF